jgi:hypothetical protein
MLGELLVLACGGFSGVAPFITPSDVINTLALLKKKKGATCRRSDGCRFGDWRLLVLKWGSGG